MEPLARSRDESVSDRDVTPRPWVRRMVAVLLRIGLGVSLLNGGLIGYLSARHGGTPASRLAWTTMLGPAAVASALENDLLVPFVQIAIGLALILGFFTVASAVVAGFLIVSGPIFQFLAILSSNESNPMESSNLVMQTLVSTGSINLLLLAAAVLWLTPVEGTPWSLDALIFAHRRHGPPPATAPATPGPEIAEPPPPGPAPPETGASSATFSASRGE
jgi:hypothetical protein